MPLLDEVFDDPAALEAHLGMKVDQMPLHEQYVRAGLYQMPRAALERIADYQGDMLLDGGVSDFRTGLC